MQYTNMTQKILGSIETSIVHDMVMLTDIDGMRVGDTVIRLGQFYRAITNMRGRP